MHSQSQYFLRPKWSSDSSRPFFKRFLSKRFPQDAQYFSGVGFRGIGMVVLQYGVDLLNECLVLRGGEGERALLEGYGLVVAARP